MAEKRNGIAFFDSGIGGLTVMNECILHGINENMYYYGDNGFAPYGNKSRLEIRERVQLAFEEFQKLNVRVAVIACNTATAICVDDLRSHFDFPIVGAEPAVFTAAKFGGEVLVLTTRATYESGRIRALCQKAEQAYPNAYLRVCPCDGLAGEIELHLFDKDYDFSRFFPKGNPSSVVLGCTHYVYLKKYVEAFYKCKAYDGNAGIARRVESVSGSKLQGDRDSQPLSTPNKNAPKIAYLGGYGGYNQHVFEQMFAK